MRICKHLHLLKVNGRASYLEIPWKSSCLYRETISRSSLLWRPIHRVDRLSSSVGCHNYGSFLRLGPICLSCSKWSYGSRPLWHCDELCHSSNSSNCLGPSSKTSCRTRLNDRIESHNSARNCRLLEWANSALPLLQQGSQPMGHRYRQPNSVQDGCKSQGAIPTKVNGNLRSTDKEQRNEESSDLVDSPL